jgi:hypothetical protein
MDGDTSRRPGREPPGDSRGAPGGSPVSVNVDPHTGDVTTVKIESSFAIQEQPSKWSCLPTAFAMVMSTPAHLVVESIGHDDQRGFHVQECLTVALSLGWVFSPHEFNPMMDQVKCRNPRCDFGNVMVSPHVVTECPECHGTGAWNLSPRITPLVDLMAWHHGVLTGRLQGADGHHAVAWDCKLQKCLDPRGIVIGLESFEPDTFWLAVDWRNDEGC